MYLEGPVPPERDYRLFAPGNLMPMITYHGHAFNHLFTFMFYFVSDVLARQAIQHSGDTGCQLPDTDGCRRRPSVMEQSHSGEVHDDAVLVAGLDDDIVSH